MQNSNMLSVEFVRAFIGKILRCASVCSLQSSVGTVIRDFDHTLIYKSFVSDIRKRAWIPGLLCCANIACITPSLFKPRLQPFCVASTMLSSLLFMKGDENWNLTREINTQFPKCFLDMYQGFNVCKI